MAVQDNFDHLVTVWKRKSENAPVGDLQDIGTTVSPGTDGAPYFFLAYAHTPQRPWVVRLYNDLCSEILERTTWPAHLPVGFMDASGIRTGEDWRNAVAGALATCRAFVPLYSPRYFSRPECGREWHAFTRRAVDHRTRYGGGTATPIVPALWTPVTESQVPAAARHVQVDFRSVHTSYAEDGLFTLIKSFGVPPHVSQGRPPARGADHPCRGGHPAPAVPRQRAAPRAGRLPRAGVRRPGPPPDDDPRRRAHRAAPAGRTRRPGLRRQPRRTGRRSSPARVQPVAQAASYIARSFDFEPSILTLEEGLATLDWSDPTTGPGVALIDPWLALDDARAEQLNRLDALDAGWLGAAVIWNQLDQQTTARADDLRKALQGIAPRRLGDAAAPPSLGVVHTHQHRTVPAAAAVGAGRRHSTGISTSAERTSAARHAAGAAVVDGTRTRRHGDARPARHGRLGWTSTATARS